MARTIPLSAAAIAAAMHGRLVAGDDDRYVTGFSIDTRTLASGDLFFAIVARRDGHDFVPAASKRRAAGIVVSRPVTLDDANEAFVIEVADTTQALQDLARFVRRESAAKVVAITGSAGKTTTKDTIAELLGSRYRVVKNAGNLNNHLGLPLSLLELRHGADVAVMELGMNHAGEIRTLVGIATPEVRVWTNVGEAHIAHFGSTDAIADAKAEIMEGASADSVLVANADDARVMARVPAFAGRVVTFGTSPHAAVRAEDIEDLGLDGSRAVMVTPAGRRDLKVPLLGRGHLMNVLASAAVALEMGIDLDAIVDRIAQLRPSSRRSAVLRLPKGVTVIDDSYNSSPSALLKSLDVVSRSWAARRIAVLGEMLELGELSESLHRDCGRVAAGCRLARLFTIGSDPARALGEAAIDAGMPRAAVMHFANSTDAAPVVADQLTSGDVVLVKGSRGTRTDLVVEHLTTVFG
ncbi:MAG TPA: UDP-N-acetylmuramoyl-tripeptide--D-alanyl-D-alanine ligase [Vicinamibacterales bacterium]|nr:UDP-N-acetylmuramoyl-tripeptide--D-alanyl-D-alanine ligase [Vicinamibacterales bacterium]